MSRIKIEADKELIRILAELIGLALAKDVLGGDEPKSTLPGFGYAMALIEKVIADHRSHMAIAAYRCAAKVGHDVSRMSNCYSTFANGKFSVEMDQDEMES